MKKSVLIVAIVLLTLGLTSFVFINKIFPTSSQIKSENKVVMLNNAFIPLNFDEPEIDLVYDVKSRFYRTITKEELSKVKSVEDIFSKELTYRIESYQIVKVSILNNKANHVAFETGTDMHFNDAQLELLKSADYSSNILIRAEFKEKNTVTDELWYNYHTPHITVVPENEAAYAKGKEALISYLKESLKPKTSIITKDKLKAGKVSFTVTKSGSINDVKLVYTSGYASIDEALLKTISNIPGEWKVATDGQGNKVDQELIFYFGMEGC